MAAPSTPQLPTSTAGGPTATSAGARGSLPALQRPTSPSKAATGAGPHQQTPIASGPTISYPLPRGLDLVNTNVLITGSTSGIGLEAAKMLCAKNARVFLLGDDYEKGQRALRSVQEAVPKARVDFFQCDLVSLKSVRTFATAFKSMGLPLHVLVLNAGTLLLPYRKTPDGFEVTMAVNYLGHFYLAHLLLPELQASTPSRIVWPSSTFELLGTMQWGDLGGEFARDSDLLQYSNSKLYCLMAMREMAKRLKGTGVDVFATHPGLVDTPGFNKSASEKPLSWLLWAAGRAMGQSATRGAYSIVYAAAAPEMDGKGGAYFGPPYFGPFCPNVFNTSRMLPLNPRYYSDSYCRRLYEETAQLLEEKTGQRPLPNKLPPLYREHSWQERVAGKDRAHPVDSTLDTHPPPYRAHEAVAHLKQALHGSGVGTAPARVAA